MIFYLTNLTNYDKIYIVGEYFYKKRGHEKGNPIRDSQIQIGDEF